MGMGPGSFKGDIAVLFWAEAELKTFLSRCVSSPVFFALYMQCPSELLYSLYAEIAEYTLEIRETRRDLASATDKDTRKEIRSSLTMLLQERAALRQEKEDIQKQLEGTVFFTFFASGILVLCCVGILRLPTTLLICRNNPSRTSKKETPRETGKTAVFHVWSTFSEKSKPDAAEPFTNLHTADGRCWIS